MSDAVFPVLPGLAFGVQKVAEFSTGIQQATSGREYRLGFWPYPLWRLTLRYDALRESAGLAEMRALVGFFLARLGAADSFLLADPDDCRVTLQSIGTGNGSATDFQLTRAFGPFMEPVHWPAVITAVQVDGAPVAFTQLPRGLIRLSTPAGAGKAVSWSGTYYHRCRFDADRIKAEKVVDRLWQAGEVALLGSLQDRFV